MEQDAGDAQRHPDLLCEHPNKASLGCLDSGSQHWVTWVASALPFDLAKHITLMLIVGKQYPKNFLGIQIQVLRIAANFCIYQS